MTRVNRSSSSKFWKLVAAFCIILTFGTFVYYSNDGGDIAQISTPTPPVLSPFDQLQKNLQESKMKWEQAYKFREIQEQEAKHQDPGKPVQTKDKSTFWDYFPASFPCPYEVKRVGKDGDGGKYVCGFSEIKKLSECVVYSFGINNEVTFEEMILQQTNCTIRMYDIIKIRRNPAALMKKFGGRITYSEHGIGYSPNNSLKAIMAKNGDFFINILKMDIEGNEWVTLLKAAMDFPDGLPISQLQVEIHASHLKPKEVYPAMRNWWYYLENAGLRPFYNEPNPFYPLVYWEYSFLSVKFGMFKMETPLDWERKSDIPADMMAMYKKPA